ncbi:hypothetical protein [Roseivivax marinus]|uniref:hypothetical protein n=1 Tax=Roseivivax marinus TaxID=1379903 RepID=UPI00273F9136|nr:hypothetical protein [Roseivivax marinus]
MVDLRAWQIRRQDPDESYRSDRDRRVQFAVEALRSDRDIGTETRNAIADLLEEKKPKGRPAKPPSKWYEVGILVEEDEKKLPEIADELGVGERTAERGWNYFKKVREAQQRANLKNGWMDPAADDTDK